MRRAGRLFRIVQILPARRLTTAALLAEKPQVSKRTIYRYIAGLGTSGVPVEGEAGGRLCLAREDRSAAADVRAGMNQDPRFASGPLPGESRQAALRLLSTDG
jgi:DeoR/GlpR family transcriptional regulator of sugar metabolism